MDKVQALITHITILHMSQVQFQGDTFTGLANLTIEKLPFDEIWRVALEQDSSTLTEDQDEPHLFVFDAVTEQEGMAVLASVEAIGDVVTEDELDDLNFAYF